MRTNNNKLINGLLVLLCMLSVQMAAPRLSVAGYNVTLSAAPPSVPADGSTPSVITAAVDENGGIMSGVALTFTITAGPGVLQSTPYVAYTDLNGEANVRIYSNSPGTATVTCTAASPVSLSRNVFVNFSEVPTPTPTPDPSYPYSIALTVTPPSVPADNLSTSEISAQLYDQYGKSMAYPGVWVVFTTTTASALFSNNQPTITASTNGSGTATALLHSSVVGPADVRASCSGCAGLTTNLPPVYVNFTGSGPTADILLSANPGSNPADSQSASTITATLYDGFGQTVTSGIKVTFATTLGKFTNNGVSIDAYTNSLGIATAFVSSGSIGIAQISASSNGVTRYVNVSFTGVGPPAYISLVAVPNWIPADGHTYTAITAIIQDSAGQPVAAGTAVTFTTTLGVFENGKTTYVAATPDDTGTLTVYLRATSAGATGTAVITCTSGSASQSLSVSFVQLEYETEPNNDMAHADVACFNSVYLAQLFSPYEEDWYTFTITTPSRIGINFITTAIPVIAGDCVDSTTVGTYRVDIRDGDNNVLMSYQNVDCSLDNGIWETGVVPSGKYYIVVFCPRLPDNSHYLSSVYYLAVFDNFYLPCGKSDKLTNAASLSPDASAYQLHVPIIDPAPYFWADLQYDPIPGTSQMFRVTDYGLLANLDAYRACNLSTLSLVDGNYVLHIPMVVFDGVSYRVDLTYVPTTDGQIWFMLSGVWLN